MREPTYKRGSRVLYATLTVFFVCMPRAIALRLAQTIGQSGIVETLPIEAIHGFKQVQFGAARKFVEGKRGGFVAYEIVGNTAYLVTFDD